MILYRPALARSRASRYWRKVRLLFKNAAGTPICTRAVTWSRINDTRGEITRVMPGSSRAGIW